MKPGELPPSVRKILVQEIERWQKEGRISTAQADDLRQAYDFDFRPESPPEPQPPPPPPPAVPSPPPVVPPAPRPRLTLAQTLLSETSIKVALYLGAFFVIAAALILAALVAALRLPILLTVTVLFAGGALALKRRLPQPSFILYLVFSALLPITAGVLADMLDLSGKTATGYWAGVLFVMALVWGVSTRLYLSRLFSLAALLALDVALIMAGRLADWAPHIFYLFLLTLAGLAGLVGVAILRRWQGDHMALPLFLLAQVQQGLILCYAIVLLFTPPFGPSLDGWHPVAAATWLLTAAFAALSNLIFPLNLYPWIAAAALMPVAWLAIVRLDSWQAVKALTLAGWGMLLALAGEVAFHIRERLRGYALPLSLAGVLLLVIGAGFGWREEFRFGLSLRLGILLGSALLLSILQVLRGRAWLWAIALGFGLAAYFTVFQLPFAENRSILQVAKFAAVPVLLLLPDLLLPSGRPAPAWRWPLRSWAIPAGLVALIANASYVFFLGSIREGRTAVAALVLLGIFYLIHALRFRRPWLGILFSIHITLAFVLGLVVEDVEEWLPILACLAVAFFGVGILLFLRSRPGWSRLFRWSGLVLAGILALAAFSYEEGGRGWFTALLGVLFLSEAFLSPWLETAAPLVFSLAFGMVLYDAEVDPAVYYIAGIALLFLGLDLFYTRLKVRHEAKWITFSLGCIAALLVPLLAVVPQQELAAGAWCCAGLAILFVLQALIRRWPRLGYAATASFALVALFTSLNVFDDRWLWTMIVTALVYYGLNFLLAWQKKIAWASVLRNSGLGLASITALCAPLERSGLQAAIPVAIAASLWALDAFRRRNVWLGFPALTLYLMSYFMILAELNVDQPQFYSVGAAVLGMLMHYLLVRAGSRIGAFLTGMISQLVLLGTSYIQFFSTEEIVYFLVMFIQSLAVLVYGIVVRSRSLVITPIMVVIVGVITVIFGVLRGMSTVILVGCTGIGLILLGIAALLMRERIGHLRDALKEWRP